MRCKPGSAFPWETLTVVKVPNKVNCPYCKLPIEAYVAHQRREAKYDGHWETQDRKRMLVRCEQFKYRRLEPPPQEFFSTQRYDENGGELIPEPYTTMIHSCGKVSFISILDMAGLSSLMYDLLSEPETCEQSIYTICERLQHEQEVIKDKSVTV